MLKDLDPITVRVVACVVAGMILGGAASYLAVLVM